MSRASEKTEQIHFWATAEAKESYAKWAEVDRRSLADWIRVTLDERVRERELEGDDPRARRKR